MGFLAVDRGLGSIFCIFCGFWSGFSANCEVKTKASIEQLRNEMVRDRVIVNMNINGFADFFEF